jgi:ATP-binding cassette subfamily B protein
MKLIAQHDQMDCGPACLAMIASIYGKEFSLQYLKENAYLTKEGVSLSDISDLAERIGFETYPSQIDLVTLKKEGALPCILYWNKNHFVVLHDYKKKLFSK